MPMISNIKSQMYNAWTAYRDSAEFKTPMEIAAKRHFIAGYLSYQSNEALAAKAWFAFRGKNETALFSQPSKLFSHGRTSAANDRRQMRTMHQTTVATCQAATAQVLADKFLRAALSDWLFRINTWQRDQRGFDFATVLFHDQYLFVYVYGLAYSAEHKYTASVLSSNVDYTSRVISGAVSVTRHVVESGASLLPLPCFKEGRVVDDLLREPFETTTLRRGQSQVIKAGEYFDIAADEICSFDYTPGTVEIILADEKMNSPTVYWPLSWRCQWSPPRPTTRDEMQGVRAALRNAFA